jgi:hypothetical protein
MDHAAPRGTAIACTYGMDGAFSVTVLRRRSELSAVAADCADLALHCAENSRLDQPAPRGHALRARVDRSARPRQARRADSRSALPRLYQGLPLVALSHARRSCASAGSRGAARAARLVPRGRRRRRAARIPAVLRAADRSRPAFAEVARQREQLVLATAAPTAPCTLLVARPQVERPRGEARSRSCAGPSAARRACSTAG